MDRIRVFRSVKYATALEGSRLWAPLSGEAMGQYRWDASTLLDEQLTDAQDAMNIVTKRPEWPFGFHEEVLPINARHIR